MNGNRSRVLGFLALVISPAFQMALADCPVDPPVPAGELPSIASGPPDDTRFIVLFPTLDLCYFAGAGPINIDIPVDRYAGPVNGSQNLLFAQELIDRSQVEPYAKLRIVAYDVDYYGSPVYPPGTPPERDRVRFNGMLMRDLKATNPEFLRGADGAIGITDFEIPIEKVKFPRQRGTNGGRPQPALNRVTIDVDVLGFGCWCVFPVGISLEIGVMSPIVLVHGNNSDGEFFDRQGLRLGLAAEYLLGDYSIDLSPPDFRIINAGRLRDQLPVIADSFGVDSIHVVAHSKGGLDFREYLEKYYDEQSQFRVLSLTTLSTPHNGSMLADVAVARRNAADRAERIHFSQTFPPFSGTLAAIVGTDQGVEELQTRLAPVFNSRNLPELPRSVRYAAIAADADRNLSGRIEGLAPPLTTVNEYLGMTLESDGLAAIEIAFGSAKTGRLVDVMYQILRRVRSVSVTYTTEISLGQYIHVARVDGFYNPLPQGNDIFVTVRSGLGRDSFEWLASSTVVEGGTTGRNHASIANAGMGATIAEFVWTAETNNHGDLDFD